MQGWLIALVAFAYLALLFAIAAYGDHRSPGKRNKPRPFVYALSIAVYCTSWTFFGSVGVAADRGFEYFGIYLGPILMFTIGLPLVRRIVRLSHAERITSVADFLAARYGKNARIAALAAVIAIVGTVPYIALQLKALSDAVTLMVSHYSAIQGKENVVNFDVALVIAVSMIAFAVLFGTRHADATEHQDGLILAVAVESIIKVGTFLIVAFAIVFFSFGGLGPIVEAYQNSPTIAAAMDKGSSVQTWVVLTVLSASAIIVLPRQFHVIAVENRSDVELSRAAWVFPMYLITINALVIPVAIAGTLFVNKDISADLYLLALPLQAGNDWLAMITFIGGLSAATAMVIVATVALSIMISNNIVIPFVLWRFSSVLRTTGGNWSSVILNTRRVSIAIVIFAAYAYYEQASQTEQLATIGLLSFAALAQFAPAMLIGLFWRGANARGAFAGLFGGFIVWAYTLLFPALFKGTMDWIDMGPFGVAALKPEALLGLDMPSLNHGVMWSLGINIFLIIGASLTRAATPLERIQASAFVPITPQSSVSGRSFTTAITVDELKDTVGRYVGVARMERAFATFEVQENRKLIGNAVTDVSLARYAEQILASAVGSSSARLVLGLLLEKEGSTKNDTTRLLDDASEALQQNRGLLQIALDQMDQGISVFDSNYQLTNWNGQFRRLLNLPPEFGQFGLPIKTLTAALVSREEITEETQDLIVKNLSQLRNAWQLHLKKSGRILELRSNTMPDGGLVVTYADITGRVEADEALQSAKDNLELRVAKRTSELTLVNAELAKAREEAEKANIGKTRFLASAGHDISQPLNAARLYTASLVERSAQSDGVHHEMALKIDKALNSVESIIGAVLDISRLDAGRFEPSPSVFSMGDFLDQLRNDFMPMALEKNLKLIVMPSSAVVETDRALLMRLAQNLVSNAIKYTPTGKVLVGVRRSGRDLSLCVYDTGIGIPENQVTRVFKEFERLSEGAVIAGGLGLGLSIVDRIARVISAEVSLKSSPRKGSAFTVSLSPADPKLLPVSKSVAPLLPLQNISQGLVVACIDNEPTIVAGMATLLSGWGAKVLTATNRTDLFTVISSSDIPPQAIIADYHLDLDDTGLAVIKAVRQKLGSDLPAILITADRSKEIRQAAAQANVIMLNKPLKPAALRALLQTIPTSTAQAAE
ncbi:MAG: hybrid sensor histidine kinase/response regulator [Ahrensia sp.]|nr:hybrid sensor histidine kinase/response regulator [Ahrensia sp.]